MTLKYNLVIVKNYQYKKYSYFINRGYFRYLRQFKFIDNYY